MTIFAAFDDVQHAYDDALASALQFTYETILRSGYSGSNSSRRSAIASAVTLSASEHPARKSGISTLRSGLNTFAVSAMKCTPQNTITSASLTSRALLANSN